MREGLRRRAWLAVAAVAAAAAISTAHALSPRTASHGMSAPPSPPSSLVSRRSSFTNIGAAVAAAAVMPFPAAADYGQAPPQALPAFVPSPIRPTGEMAKTCEIVALGREDVCLKELPRLSAYDQLKLRRVKEELEGEPESNEAVARILSLVRAVESASWEDCNAQVPPSGVAWLDLRSACKKKEPSAAVKALVTLANGL